MRRLILTALFFIAALALNADERISHRFETAVPLRSVRQVIVEIPAGEIHVRNGNTNDLVASGAVRQDADDDDDDDRAGLQRAINDVSVEVYTNNDTAIVRRHFGPNARGWRVTKFSAIDLDLTVPKGVAISFETKAGELWLEGTFGDLDADLRAGEIHLTTPRAAVRELNASCRIGEVHASLGDRTITREGVLPGTTHFVNPEGGHSTVNLHTTAGEVHVTLTGTSP